MGGAGDRGRKERVRDDVRARVAEGAARLISEGMADYHAAKLKAARQLGHSGTRSLPDNHEVEAALRHRISLFQSDVQPAVLVELREFALNVMRWLDRFTPWLAGAVLNGTAGEFDAIELELVAIEPKDLELFLLNEGVEFVTCPPGARERANFSMQYQIDYAEVPVKIALFDSHVQRMATYPRSSLRHERVQLFDAEKQFAHETKPGQRRG